jgi:uncharacterized protein (UPF0335 family)
LTAPAKAGNPRRDDASRRSAREPAMTDASTDTTDINPQTAGQLKAFVERIERLEEEKKTVSEDIKEVYAEAKANGFDTKVLRKVIAIRKQDIAERRELEELIEVYLTAVGTKP